MHYESPVIDRRRQRVHDRELRNCRLASGAACERSSRLASVNVEVWRRHRAGGRPRPDHRCSSRRPRAEPSWPADSATASAAACFLAPPCWLGYPVGDLVPALGFAAASPGCGAPLAAAVTRRLAAEPRMDVFADTCGWAAAGMG